MKSKFIFTFFLSIGFFAFKGMAQKDLRTLVPTNSIFVMSFHGKQMLEKANQDQLDRLIITDFLLKKLMDDTTKENVTISDIGIKLDASAYLFYEQTDSISYLGCVVPLTNAAKFESMLTKLRKDSTSCQTLSNGNKFCTVDDFTISWNANTALFIKGETTYQYFNTKVYKRYTELEGVVVVDDYDDYTIDEEYVEGADTIVYEPIDRDAYLNYDTAVVVDTAYAEYDSTSYIPADTLKVSEDPTNNDDEELNEEEEEEVPIQFSTYNIQWENRKIIGAFWVENKLSELFQQKESASIVSNANFMNSKHKEADIQYFFSGGKSNRSLLKMSAYRTLLGLKDNDLKVLSSENNYSDGGIYFKPKTIESYNDSYLDEQLVEPYKKITHNKLNSKFFKYLPANNLMGLYSYAFSVEGMFEAVPELMKPYFELFPQTKGISNEMMDLAMLFIDEKSIGKFIKGDGVLAVTGLTKIEKEFTTYVYDSSFNSVPVVKTKEETIPNFVYMFTTEDEISMKKLLSILVKKQLLKARKNYYEVNMGNKMGFSIYVVVKKGIVHIFNTEEQLEVVLGKSRVSPLSSAQRKRMSTSSSYFFVDFHKILTSFELSKKEKDVRLQNFTGNNIRQLYAYSKKVKNASIQSEVNLNIPDGHNNSLTYIYYLIDQVYLLSTEIEK